MKGFFTSNGCEALSNEGHIKYILSKTMNFPERGMEQSVYILRIFVHMEGNFWEEADSGSSFVSIDEFLKVLSRASVFSEAYNELIKDYTQH